MTGNSSFTPDTVVLGVYNGQTFSTKLKFCKLKNGQVEASNVEKQDIREGNIPGILLLNDKKVLFTTPSYEKLLKHLHSIPLSLSLECAPN